MTIFCICPDFPFSSISPWIGHAGTEMTGSHSRVCCFGQLSSIVLTAEYCALFLHSTPALCGNCSGMAHGFVIIMDTNTNQWLF